LLTDLQRDAIEMVLVSPRNPLNIGAAARAMANFGFARLAVVAPFDRTWREARSAIGSADLLQNARETATLAAAVTGCTLVVGTGNLTYRKPEQPVVPLPELAPLVCRELKRGGRVAVVFGSEKHGLTVDDLSFCHCMVEIPTDARQPSMNLGQAVAVCLYELATRVFVADAATKEMGSGAKAQVTVDAFTARLKSCPDTGQEISAAVRSGSLDLLAGLIEQVMRAADYSPNSMQAANRHDLRVLLRRIALTEQDVRRILGLFRRILWRLNRARKLVEHAAEVEKPES
jgi:tRNA/rRNA methyltransferase